MAGRPFEDPSTRPGDETLHAALGPAFAPYRTLAELTAPFRREWAYSKSGGWMLKIHDRSKALLYVIPLAGSFRISLAIREAERDTLLADSQPALLHDRLATARKFSEGFALQFDVCSDADLEALEPFLTKLIALRG